MDQQTIDQLKSEHGEVHIIEADGAEIAVRMPTVPEFDRFSETSTNEKKAARALKQLVKDCLLHPSREAFDEMVAKRPGLFLPFGKELARISGATVEAEGKKA